MVARKKPSSDEEAVAVLLEELPDNYLACRDLRHAWSIDNDFFVYKDPKHERLLVVSRELVCMRCETKRREVFIQRKWGLEKIRNSYEYPEDYQLKGTPRGVKASTIVSDVQYRKAMKKVAALAREQGVQ